VIKTGDRVKVSTFLFEDWATVTDVFAGELLPIQVVLDDGDADGHRVKRVKEDEVMPFYTFACAKCGTQKDELVPMGTQSTTCAECGEPTVKQPSFKFNGHGLPNGFSSTRSQSRKE
jgi:putative FmdB family regulatory protein